MSDPCICNAYQGKAICCVTDCQNQRPGRGGCYPCNCWRNTSLCLHTEQTRTQKKEALRA
jgi:hypothetical protein